MAVGTPGPSSVTTSTPCPPVRRPSIHTRVPGGVWSTTFSSRL